MCDDVVLLNDTGQPIGAVPKSTVHSRSTPLHFRYAAVDANGIMENEICPIYTAIAGGPLRPDPAEIMDYAWVDPSDLEAALKCAPWACIPWFTLQAEQLDRP